MSRVLVTGALGFIGGLLVLELKRNAMEVGIMDIGVDEQGDYDGVIHLAGMSRVSECDRDPMKCLDTNIMLTASVIERGIGWMILASTKERQTNVYGLSKRFAEDYAALMSEQRGFRLEVIRFPVVYGEFDNPKRLIPRVREGAHINRGALPLTALWVNHAVEEIIQRIKFINKQSVITTEGDLRRVAASY